MMKHSAAPHTKLWQVKIIRWGETTDHRSAPGHCFFIHSLPLALEEFSSKLNKYLTLFRGWYPYIWENTSSSLPSITTSVCKMKGYQTKQGVLLICVHIKLKYEVGICCLQLKEFLLFTKLRLLSLGPLILFLTCNWELVFTNLIPSDCSRQKGSLSLFIQYK